MLIKICGMKEPGNVTEVAALHPDMLGFIFYKASPRYAGDLSPRALERLPAAIGKVGVFVNAETGFIENIVRRYRMDTIQLHGDDPPEMGHYFVRKGYRVIKAFGIEEAGDFQRTLPYESACQLFLFDTRSRQFGGTGKSFDWNLLNRYEGSVPFFLSGGIAWEKRKDRNLLSVYFTAGYPVLEDTVEIIQMLENRGVDLVEIGIPFSDPMADGVVIQQSSTQALKNGMTLPVLLGQLTSIRSRVELPLLLMGYLNPMLRYGMENLFRKGMEIGIDGMIIPDLPFQEYLESVKPLCEKYDIPVIMLITPETSDERIRLIDEYCGGFIYMVSSASTTGVKDRFTAGQIEYFQRIDRLNLKNKRLIGFGISNGESLSTVCRYSSGAIIGSLFVKLLGTEPTVEEAVDHLLKIAHRDGL